MYEHSCIYRNVHVHMVLMGISTNLQLNYQWLPQYYHIDLVCPSTFEIREKINGVTEYTVSEKMLVENDQCAVSIVACLKEDQGATDSAMCLWKVKSQLHNFTGMYGHIMCVCAYYVYVCVYICV